MEPIWRPSEHRIQTSPLRSFVDTTQGTPNGSYEELHQWSIDHPEDFWRAVWRFTGVFGDPGATVVKGRDSMPGATWFPEAHLNFAQNLLEHGDPCQIAIVFRSEQGTTTRLTYGELRQAVAKLAAAMRAEGIQAGDRIAAFMPNLPETVMVMLAAASIGAIFSSSSPDFGVRGVLDRFGQIEPAILFAADGYHYNGKTISCIEKIAAVVSQLKSVRRVVITPHLHPSPDLSPISGAMLWADFTSSPNQQQDVHYEPLPFNHPLYILYSSGTTGVPKCIVHGAGGTLLQHLKEHQLHAAIHPGDRLFYFTTTGWMMWNWLVSGLASAATILLYDGSPFCHQGRILFDYAEQERATHFGTSAKFLDALAKTGLQPISHWSLTDLTTIFSTGSPLAPEGFDFVYRDIKHDVNLASISGGTDIVSCFVLGNPMLPVYRGQIQCKGLGMAVDVFGEDGRPVRREKGDLVCTRPFPSMPLGFWNDLADQAYHAAYFERFPGVWCHGDYAEITPQGGIVIYGRSDATLNPGGVRIGTAEIYRQVEQLPEILESIAVGQEWNGDVRIVLFVRLRCGILLDDALSDRIRKTIRMSTTPRHVPAKIIAVPDIPRTKSGKMVELAVRDVIHGRPVKNRESLANPEALEYFRDLQELLG